MGYRQPSSSTRMLDEAVLLDLSEVFVVEMQDIFIEHQRKLRVELERACRPLNQLLPKRDEDLEEGGAGPLKGSQELLQLAMAVETTTRHEGGGSTSVEECRKQIAEGPRSPLERHLRRIVELEEALRIVKARGKRPEITPVPRQSDGPKVS